MHILYQIYSKYIEFHLLINVVRLWCVHRLEGQKWHSESSNKMSFYTLFQNHHRHLMHILGQFYSKYIHLYPIVPFIYKSYQSGMCTSLVSQIWHSGRSNTKSFLDSVIEVPSAFYPYFITVLLKIYL